MVGIIRTNSNAKATGRKYWNPVQRGLEYSFLGDLEDVGFNYAPGKPSASVVGTPVRGADSFSWRFKGLEDYLQTEMTDTAAQTFICVARTFDTLADNDTKPTFFGTSFGLPSLQETSSVTFGSRMYITTAGAMRWGAGRGTSVSDDVQATPSILNDADAYEIYVMQTGTQNKITSATSGLTDTDAETAARFPTQNMFRIGSGFESSTTGENDIAVLRGWGVDLTTDEIAAEVADVRAYMAGLGITV